MKRIKFNLITLCAVVFALAALAAFPLTAKAAASYSSLADWYAVYDAANPVQTDLVSNGGGNFTIETSVSSPWFVTNAITIASGETLTVTGGVNFYGSLNSTGGTIMVAAGGELRHEPGSGTHTLSADIQNNGTVIISNASGTVEYSGNITGSGSLIIYSNSGWTVTLSGANTYSGGTQLNGGTLSVASQNNIGTGILTFVGGILNITAATEITSDITIFNNITIDIGINTVTISGNIQGGGTLTKSGAGMLTLTGNNTSWSGGTRISGGVLSVASQSNIGTGTITLNGGMLSFTADVTFPSTMDIILTGSSTINTDSNNVTISGNITGSNLTKLGAGTLTLTGSNSCNGTTAVAGTLVLGNGYGGNSPITVYSTSTLTIPSGVAITSSNFPINNLGTFTLAGSLTTNGGAFANEYTGTTTISGTFTNGGTMNNYGKIFITPSGTLTQNGVVNASADGIVIRNRDGIIGGTGGISDLNVYGISLTGTMVSGTINFVSQPVGYTTGSSFTDIVTNIGNQPTGTLSLSLSGANPTAFEFTDTSLAVITTIGSLSATGINSEMAFRVAAKTGLAAGTYSATVTVSMTTGGGALATVVSESYNISFTVSGNDVTVTTAAELRAALESVSPSTITLGGNLTLNMASDIFMGADHTLDTNGNTLTVTGNAYLATQNSAGNAPRALTINGGGAVTIAGTSCSIYGNGTLNLENVTVNLNNSNSNGIRVRTLNVGNGAVVNIDSATGNSLIRLDNGCTMTVNSGGTVNIENILNPYGSGIYNIGTLHINGGTINIGDCQGSVGIYNEDGALLKITSGTFSGTDGSIIWLAENSTVESVNGVFTDRGIPFTATGQVTVGVRTTVASANGLSYGVYEWNGGAFESAPENYTLYYDHATSNMYSDSGFTTAVSGLTGWSGNGAELTLNNFYFVTGEEIALVLPSGTTLNLIGNNTIISAYQINQALYYHSNPVGIFVFTGSNSSGGLTVSGTGTLNVSGGNAPLVGGTSTGIAVVGTGALNITGGTVNATGGTGTASAGLDIPTLNVTGGTVNATGFDYGIVARTINITGGTTTAIGETMAVMTINAAQNNPINIDTGLSASGTANSASSVLTALTFGTFNNGFSDIWYYETQAGVAATKVVIAPLSNGGNGGNSGNNGGGSSSDSGTTSSTPRPTTLTATIPANGGAAQVPVRVTDNQAVISMTASVRTQIRGQADDIVSFDLSGIDGLQSAVLSRADWNYFANADLGIALQLPHGTLTFDNTAAASIGATATGSNIICTIVNTIPNMYGDGDYTVSIEANGSMITAFDGALTVTVPYNGELPVGVWAMFLYEDDTLEQIPAVYDPITETVTFTTNGSGVFRVGFDFYAPPPAGTVLRFAIGSTAFDNNGTTVYGDAAPFIDPETNRTMIPVRAIAEALGATVDWDETTRTVTITLVAGASSSASAERPAQNGVTVSLPIDEPLPDGMGMATIINGRTFVPLRYVSEILGANVDWDEVNREVVINY